jgi:predicted anti-sigma-YlaC factor YlaD
MNEHVDAWIDAYLDGELSARKKQRLETHLAQCPRCRAQITQYRALSVLLQDIPPAYALKPQEQFVAEVGLQLKERHLRMQPPSALYLGWQSIPVVLLLLWIFIQTVTYLSGLLAVIPGAKQTLYSGISASMPSLFGLPELVKSIPGSLEILRQLGVFNIIDWNWFTSLVLWANIALMYLIWLASWLVYNRQPQNWHMAGLGTH